MVSNPDDLNKHLTNLILAKILTTVWSTEKIAQKMTNGISERRIFTFSVSAARTTTTGVRQNGTENLLGHHKLMSLKTEPDVKKMSCENPIHKNEKFLRIYFDPLSEIITAIDAKCYIVRC